MNGEAIAGCAVAGSAARAVTPGAADPGEVRPTHVLRAAADGAAHVPEQARVVRAGRP